MTQVTETPALPFDLDDLTDEQLLALKKAAQEKRQELAKAAKEAKAPTFRALYKCEGCNCSGLMGPTGMSVYCDRSGKGQKFAKPASEVRKWALGQRKAKDASESELEPDGTNEESEAEQEIEVTV